MILHQHNASKTAPNFPISAIGFTVISNSSPTQLKNSQTALENVLAHFDDINQSRIQMGNTILVLWGRGELSECTYSLSDGSILALIGSPLGDFSWQEIEERLLNASISKPFELPWDGRVILLKINPTGDIWTLWNDWIGSIPVYHAPTKSGQIASTLEPVAVDTVGFTEDNIFLPAMLALLIWGHYFSDWTLFRELKVIPPDCMATWKSGDFQIKQIKTITPSEDHLETGWDDLIDEMHFLSRQAITQTLGTHHQWILPLSSGLDSRLIAGVAAELGTNVFAYTWGPAKTSDTIHAKSIAQTLNIPWKNIPPGNSYLKTYRQLWANIFGRSMHFHGMYQMPFLDSLEHEPTGPIVSGFIGDCLAGYDVKFLVETNSSHTPYLMTPNGYLHCTIDDLNQLMKVPIDDALEELANEVYAQLEKPSGALYHRLRLNIIWGRQRFFTYFQSMLSDYWRGVATPYLNRAYAQFSYSLPRVVLDERMLQQAMLRRYYPKLATIPGTYAPEPALLTGSYLLKKRAAKYLPATISKFIFPGLKQIRSNSDIDCVRSNQEESFYPVFEHLNLLAPWMNTNIIEESYQNIISNNDIQAVRRLQSIQTLAYHLAS